MKTRSTIEVIGKKRMPPLRDIICGVAILFLIGCIGSNLAMKSMETQRRAMASLEANVARQNLRFAEIDRLRGKLLGAETKEKRACINAAGFNYPEESAENELARLRRIDLCVNQLTKP
jgi:hypothetical protein